MRPYSGPRLDRTMFDGRYDSGRRLSRAWPRCRHEEVRLDLTAPTTDLTDAATFAKWVKVHDRVRSGEMPPPKKGQPPATEREAMLKELVKLLTDTDTRRQ